MGYCYILHQLLSSENSISIGDKIDALNSCLTILSFFVVAYTLFLTREHNRKQLRVAAITAQLSVLTELLDQEIKYFKSKHPPTLKPEEMTCEQIDLWIASYEKEQNLILAEDFKKVNQWKKKQKNIYEELESLINRSN